MCARCLYTPELSIGWVDPWVGLGRVSHGLESQKCIFSSQKQFQFVVYLRIMKLRIAGCLAHELLLYSKTFFPNTQR